MRKSLPVRFPAGFRDRRKKQKPRRLNKTSFRRPRTTESVELPHTTSVVQQVEDEKSNQIKGNYILNLQQQISLLEMELDMQKKMNSEQMMKTFAGSEPLEDSMTKIKLAFVQRQKEYEDIISTLEKQVDTFEKRYETAIQRIDLLQEEKSREAMKAHEEREEDKSRFIAEVVGKQKIIDKLEFELSNSKQFVEDGLKKENQNLRNDIYELKEEMVQLKNMITEKELSLRASTHKYDKYQEETDELIRKSKYAVEQYSELEQQVIQLRNENKNLKNESLRSAIEIKKLQLDKTELSNQKANFELKITQDYLPRLIELEKLVKEKEQQNLLQIEEKERKEEEGNELRQKVEKYEKTLRNFRKDHDEMKMKNEEFKLKIQHLSSELVDERNNIAKNLKMDNNRLEMENHNLKLFFEKRENEMEEMKIRDRIYLEKINVFEKRKEESDDLVDKMKRDIVDLTSDNNMLRKKLRAESLVNDLKKMDLPRLIQTNQKMSSKVKTLLSFME